MAKDKIIVLGVDDGFAETKIVGDNFQFSISSRAAAGRANKIRIGNGAEIDVAEYETDEGSYSCGDIDHAEPTNFDQYPCSSLNRVIVNHALIAAGFANKNLSVCTGLPVKSFYRGNSINKELVESKKTNLLTGKIKAKSLANVKEHSVISEAIAAWIDQVVVESDKKKLVIDKEKVNERCAVIDIGGRTTDIAIIKNFEMDCSRSSTIEAGMLDNYSYLKDEIHSEHGIELNDEQVLAAVKTGKVKLWGKQENVAKIVDAARANVASKMRSEIMRRLGSGSDIDNVIFVGGGAIAFEDLLRDMYRNQTTAHDPSFANARGMFKYLRVLS